LIEKRLSLSGVTFHDGLECRGENDPRLVSWTTVADISGLNDAKERCAASQLGAV